MRIVRWAPFVLLLLVGCGSGLKTYPLKGQVVLRNGSIDDLTKSHIEFELETDSTVRGSGLITADGRFHVEMLYKGQLVHGLPPGNYRGRVILSDEEPAAKKRQSPVARRFLDFKTADLSVTVPVAEDVVLTIASK
jgi:hypothetical protein